MQVLAGIEWCIDVWILETETIRKCERIEVVSPNKSREIADPKIEISRNIGQSGQDPILLQKELSVHGRIGISLEIRQISKVHSRREVQVFEEPAFESQPVSGVQQRDIHGSIRCSELKMGVEVPVPVLAQGKILGYAQSQQVEERA